MFRNKSIQLVELSVYLGELIKDVYICRSSVLRSGNALMKISCEVHITAALSNMFAFASPKGSEIAFGAHLPLSRAQCFPPLKSVNAA